MLRHKFNATRTDIDGVKFHSKKEAARYIALKTLIIDGVVLFFLRQTPIHLTGGIKYIVDFLIFWADGTVTFEDVKGYKTSQYLMKKKMVEGTYPITIIES